MNSLPIEDLSQTSVAERSADNEAECKKIDPANGGSQPHPILVLHPINFNGFVD